MSKLADRIPLRILAADDFAANLVLLRYICASLGYTLEVATNGVEVMELVAVNHYDMILLDVEMPKLDGYSTARAIAEQIPERRKRPRLVAATASGKGAAEDRERCLESGMDDFLIKPVKQSDLVACIERLFLP